MIDDKLLDELYSTRNQGLSGVLQHSVLAGLASGLGRVQRDAAEQAVEDMLMAQTRINAQAGLNANRRQAEAVRGASMSQQVQANIATLEAKGVAEATAGALGAAGGSVADVVQAATIKGNMAHQDIITQANQRLAELEADYSARKQVLDAEQAIADFNKKQRNPAKALLSGALEGGLVGLFKAKQMGLLK